MQTTESLEIINRMYEALGFLKERKAIRGIKTFTDRYGIDRRNFISIANSDGRYGIQPGWLTYLVRDYGVSAHWLLTGEGEPFKDKKNGHNIQVILHTAQ